MKTSLLFIFIVAGSFCYGQSKVSDSLLKEMCTSLNETQHLGDSVRLEKLFEQHLTPIFEKLDENKRLDTWDSVFFRLQRNCHEFFKIIRRNNSQKGDWEQLDSKPVSTIDEKSCKVFRKQNNFFYLESNGDRVYVKIEKGIWKDQFADGTYSELKIKWVTPCEFELEFIKSNNQIRKNMSRSGEKYWYQVLEKANGYYKMSTQVIGIERFSGFKLYNVTPDNL